MAQAEVKKSGSLPVPKHIRNAPTKLMKDLDYGKGYQYAHDDPDGYLAQDYLPEELQGEKFYKPVDRGYEKNIRERMDWWQSLKNQDKKKTKK